jgi:uncharacterized membrane protein
VRAALASSPMAAVAHAIAAAAEASAAAARDDGAGPAGRGCQGGSVGVAWDCIAADDTRWLYASFSVTATLLR